MTQRRRRGRGFSLIELIVVLGVVAVLVSIATGFFRGQRQKARQTEAKVNLKALYTTLTSHKNEYGSFECGLCGWDIGDGNLYSYYASSTASIAGRSGCAEADGAVALAEQTASGFTASACANIDSDPTCDGWNVNHNNELQHRTNDMDQ